MPGHQQQRVIKMNKLLTVAILFAVSVFWGKFAIAQEGAAQEGAARVVPVEFYSCNFQKGKGSRDLGRVVDRFRSWADEYSPSYSAWILTPQYHNGLGFDVAWMGSWPSGKAFGESEDNWRSQGGEVAAAFNSVIDCSSHELSLSVAINAPDEPLKDGLVMFTGCSMKEGKTAADAFAAHKKFDATIQGLGSDAASWLFYPGMGAAQYEYDYWRVIGFNSYTELGAGAEFFSNGGGFQLSREILSPVVSCGSSTVFNARLVRHGSVN
jgi:hypothetical protein